MSTLTPIHNHFNLREICKLELSDQILSDLETPSEPLPPMTQAQRLGLEPVPGKPHVVLVPTTLGPLVLFRVLGNRRPYVVTNTPQVAIELAEGRVAILKSAQ